jgi:hypothetical protein
MPIRILDQIKYLLSNVRLIQIIVKLVKMEK